MPTAVMRRNVERQDLLLYLQREIISEIEESEKKEHPCILQEIILALMSRVEHCRKCTGKSSTAGSRFVDHKIEPCLSEFARTEEEKKALLAQLFICCVSMMCQKHQAAFSRLGPDPENILGIQPAMAGMAG